MRFGLSPAENRAGRWDGRHPPLAAVQRASANDLMELATDTPSAPQHVAALASLMDGAPTVAADPFPTPPPSPAALQVGVIPVQMPAGGRFLDRLAAVAVQTRAARRCWRLRSASLLGSASSPGS